MASSHHDHQFLSSKFGEITENEFEDSIQSGSPNMAARFRSNTNRLNMWRTEKNISLDDYNEISDYAADYDHLDMIHDIAQNLKKAISERSVLGMSFNKKKRKFYNSVERDGSFDDDSDSVGMSHQEVQDFDEVDFQHFSNVKRQTLDNTIGYEKFDSSNKDINSEIVNKIDEVMTLNQYESSRDRQNQDLSSNKVNSLVDIDTVNGKVSAKLLIAIDDDTKGQPGGKEQTRAGQTQKIFNLTKLF